MARAFGVSESQIIRDLEVLQFCGLPGGYIDDLFDVDLEAVRDEGRIDFRNAEVLSRPLKLRPAEAASLLAALRLVVDLAGESDAAASALAKLLAAVGADGDRLQVSVAPSDPGLRTTLNEAIARSAMLRLTYRRAVEESTADVEPIRIRLVDGYSYLDAWSRPREAWRSYRLDRITDVTILGEKFEARGEPPTGWFEGVAEQLSIKVRPEAAWIAEYYPTTDVVAEGELRTVTFPVASREWAVGLLLRLGGAVVEVSDPSVGAEARTRADQALRHYPDNVQ